MGGGPEMEVGGERCRPGVGSLSAYHAYQGLQAACGMRESKKEKSTETQMAIGAHTFLKAELFWSFFRCNCSARTHTRTHVHPYALGFHWTATTAAAAAAVGSTASVLACKILRIQKYIYVAHTKDAKKSGHPTSNERRCECSGRCKKSWELCGGALLSMRSRCISHSPFSGTGKGGKNAGLHTRKSTYSSAKFPAMADITINAHHAHWSLCRDAQDLLPS